MKWRKREEEMNTTFRMKGALSFKREYWAFFKLILTIERDSSTQVLLSRFQWRN
jgi:hypothetical protein